MNVLIVGSGGREHAIAWKIRESSHTTHVFCAPGNAGLSTIATCVPIKDSDVGELKDFALDMKVDLTIIGPEAPLAAGIVDTFCKEGLPVFGPTRAAAQIEASKAFAKTIMRKMNIPTARSSRHTEAEAAIKGLDEFDPPYVIKADGLAAGKGVTVAQTKNEAEQAIRRCLDEGAFGEAGKLLLLEEYLEGEELSILALSD
jgi:phosphoribosylamine--glycine ligase